MSFYTDLTDDLYAKEILGVAGTVQVIEVYPSWAGPCKAIQSTFKRIYFDMGDKPLKFFTAASDKVTAFKEYNGKCQAVFCLMKDGVVVQKIVGVQAPQLEALIVSMLKPAAA